MHSLIYLAKVLTAVLIFSAFLCSGTLTHAAAKTSVSGDVQQIPAFCYHDVVADNDTATLAKDPYAVTEKRLEEHFKMFKAKGYTPISIKQYEDYIQGKGTLPPKPILLSFDDGRESMYTKIYPLLKKYNYPAVFAIILSYMETVPPASEIKTMVTWPQLKEMEASGLVTLASHSYNMHNFVTANQYGDRFQNVATVWYNENERYESEYDFDNRVKNDMLMGKKIFDENMGHSTDVFVWPFGVYTQYAVQEAQKAGYKYQLMLNDDKKLNNPDFLSRFIIYGNPSSSEVEKMLKHISPAQGMNAGQLDIDMIYDPMPEQFERNIDAAINKLYDMRANTVFLQTFADEDGDGNVDQVYFHTDQVKVKADVLSHVTMRLQTAGFKVFAWMPILSYANMVQNPNDTITASEPNKAGWYKRGTPFSPAVQQKAAALVKDLALYTPIDGILFQDDVYMNDFEDFSPYAKQLFAQKFHKELTMENLNADSKLKQAWTKQKTKALNDLTVQLINVAKTYRPEIQSARNIYPIVITQPESEEWFAQNYDDYLKLYDYVVIMAYPEMEEAENQNEWLKQLTKASLKNPAAKQKAVFKLQGYDWAKEKWISDKTEYNRTNIIKTAGGINFAQYPINVFDD